MVIEYRIGRIGEQSREALARLRSREPDELDAQVLSHVK
jgi:hypothetical protein